MSISAADPGLYTLGGTVQAGRGVYIKRQADDELFELCSSGTFAYVLTARQMGKSSLMVNTAQRLAEAGVRTATVDLNRIGSAATVVTAESWYLGVVSHLGKQLGLATDAIEWWQKNRALDATLRLVEFFERLVLKEVTGRVVIFIDEIDTTVRLDFKDDFFAAIRSLHNARADQPELKRLSFVLIGVTTPGELIRDSRRTPFNIGRRVELTDFTRSEAFPLADGLGLPADEARHVLDWVLGWTNGHPYLTQRLCRAIVDERERPQSRAEVNAVVERTFLGQAAERDHNLLFVRDMLTRGARDPIRVLVTYRAILEVRTRIRDDENTAVTAHLKLSGVVRAEDGVLTVRNQIYLQVFDVNWVCATLATIASPWSRRLRMLRRQTRFLWGAVAAISLAFAFYASQQSQEAQIAAAEISRQTTEAQQARATAVAERDLAEKARQAAEDTARELDWQRSVAVSLQATAVAERDRFGEERQNAIQAKQELELLTAGYRRLLTLVDNRAPGEMSSIEIQRETASAFGKIGRSQESTGDLTGALTTYAEALRQLDQLAEAAHQDVNILSEVADVNGRVGDIHQALNNFPEALGAYRRSLASYEELISAQPSEPRHKREVAVAYRRLGDAQRSLGDTQNARLSYEQSRSIFDGLVQSAPADLDWQRSLAEVHERLGDLQRATGDSQGARLGYQDAMRIVEPLARASPDDVQLKAMLARVGLKIIEVSPAPPAATASPNLPAPQLTVLPPDRVQLGIPFEVEFRAVNGGAGAYGGSITVSIEGSPDVEVISAGVQGESLTREAKSYAVGQTMYHFAKKASSPIEHRVFELYDEPWADGRTYVLRLRIVARSPAVLRVRATMRAVTGNFVHDPPSGPLDQQAAPVREWPIVPTNP